MKNDSKTVTPATAVEVPSIVKKQLDLTISMLSRLPGTQFKIILPDGTEYGELQVAAPTPAKDKARTRRVSDLPIGQLREYYGEFLKDVHPGDVKVIPVPNWLKANLDREPLERLQAGVSAYLSTNWGKGSYITTMNVTKNCLEVMRTK